MIMSVDSPTSQGSLQFSSEDEGFDESETPRAPDLLDAPPGPSSLLYVSKGELLFTSLLFRFLLVL